MRRLSLSLLLAAAACGVDEATPPIPPVVDAAVDAPIDGDPHVDLGALDPTFGTGGLAMLGEGGAMAVLTDAQDGVIACGRLPTGSGRLLRLDRHGALDHGFGADGLILLPQECRDLARLRDGRLAAVSTDSIRLFSPTDGTMLQEVHPPALSPPLGGPYLYAIAPLDDGGFAVEMIIDRTIPPPPVPVHVWEVNVARYDAAGAPVTSFGTDGRVEVGGLQLSQPVQYGLVAVSGPTPHLIAYFAGVAWGIDAATGAPDHGWDLQASGDTGGRWGIPVTALGADRALVGGYELQSGNLVVTTWNAAGATRRALPFCQPHPYAYPAAVTIDHQGRPVIVSAVTEMNDLIVIRLRPDLTGIDPAWGCERHITFPPDCTSDPCQSDPEARKGYGADVAIGSDDSIVVGGGRRLPPPQQAGPWFVARFTP